MAIYRLLLLFSVVLLSSCAVLHHISVGDVKDLSRGSKFEITISELGVNAEAIGRAMDTEKNRAGSEAAKVLGLFQWGPRTGEVVYRKSAFSGLLSALTEKCPRGKVTGLMSVREMRSYHFVSTEVVKITGYCISGG